ncbi:hypothetical protein [Chitinasiproducens palmae]|uniref:Uncharacterized protein n=1 Tax=Chitinasiproducens palmae TaxID=1770053 RepID=A0A1H2PQU3_9BURK|nr:hypothetical protein [Chitinasiproducens palmae]SDV49180.1 hypothetical protein SAMN05216551_107132 [Chitinasiproducens palmae]
MSWLEGMSDTIKAILATTLTGGFVGGVGWIGRHILSRDSLAKASAEWQKLYEQMNQRAERAEKKVEELQDEMEALRLQHRSDMDALREQHRLAVDALRDELRGALKRVTAIEQDSRS